METLHKSIHISHLGQLDMHCPNEVCGGPIMNGSFRKIPRNTSHRFDPYLQLSGVGNLF
jgi:hypothetical protein